MTNKNDIQFAIKDEFQEYKNYLISHYPIETYPKNHIFNMGGMPTNGLYFLLEGMIYVYTINEEGYVRFIGTHEQNTFFNLDSFDPHSFAIITTKAATKVKVIHLTLDDIVNIAKDHPSFYKKFLIYTGQVLRLMCYDAQQQSIPSIKNRLIDFLLFYIESHEDNIIPFAQYKIAAAINASRVQVTRICAELKKENVIEIKRNEIKIIDYQKLKNMKKTTVRQ